MSTGKPAAPGAKMNMNPVLQAMAAHRSVRKYKNQPLDEDCVQRAVASAQRAATSSNVQAYSLLWIEDAAKRAGLAELCGSQAQVREAGAFFVICADQHKNRLLGEQCARPHQANLETFMLGVIDATLFAQNLALAFESMGLATCFIGGLRNDLPGVDALLGLPADVMPLFGLCAGWAETGAAEQEQRPRLPLGALLMRERYLDDAELMEQIQAYDAQMAGWYERQGRAGYDWSGGVSRNFQRTKRDGLLAYYASKGAQFR